MEESGNEAKKRGTTREKIGSIYIYIYIYIYVSYIYIYKRGGREKAGKAATKRKENGKAERESASLESRESLRAAVLLLLQGGDGEREREERERERSAAPAGHDPANEPVDANQSHDAALQIVHLRSNAAIPFPVAAAGDWGASGAPRRR